MEGQGPRYIQRLSQVYNPGTSLRSSSRGPLLTVARVNHAVGEKPPSRMALHLWNYLRESLRVLGTKAQLSLKHTYFVNTLVTGSRFVPAL